MEIDLSKLNQGVAGVNAYHYAITLEIKTSTSV
jgi:hypothetical protein